MKKLLCVTLIAGTLFLCSCSADPGTSKEIDATAASVLAQQVVEAKVDEFYDDYAAYYTPTEYQRMVEDYQGSFGGIGITMVEVDGEVTVYNIIKDTPAADSDIAVGDVLLAVDGISLEGKGSTDAQSLIRGPVGEQVTIQLRKSSDNSTYEETLERETINEETITSVTLPAYPGTVYMRISSFTSTTSSDFAAHYNKLLKQREIENLILDLRSNGGGNFYACIAIGSYFVPMNEVVVSEKTSTGEEDHRSSSGQLNGLNVIVLQNAYTASASEVLIGALKDKANTTLIGTTTYGKGITQGIVLLSSGSGHRYTRSIYFTPSGFSLNGIGIEPDILIEDPENTTYNDYFSLDPAKNPHLEAALNYLFPDGAPSEDGMGSVDGDTTDDTADSTATDDSTANNNDDSEILEVK